MNENLFLFLSFRSINLSSVRPCCTKGSKKIFNLGSSPAPDVHYKGIWLQNCNGAKVVSNEITNNEPATGTVNFRGIDVEASGDCRINCNTLTNLPYSMRFFSNCDGTLLRKNILTGYDEGIHLDGATLPDQFQWNGPTKEPLDNAWNDPPQPSGQPTDRVTGNIGGLNPFFWFVRNTGGIYNPLDGGTTNQNINVTPIAQGTVLCNDFSNRQDRDERFGAVVGDSLQFEEYQNENLYFAKVNAYKAMKDDSTIIYTGGSGDAAYENFYNTMDASNIGSFETVNELAADTNTIGLAACENAAIVDTNSIEYFKKSVNDIYLNNTAQHLPLSSTDSSFLDYVTTLSVYSAGNAIYFAAAMIGKELHPGYVAMRRVKPIPVQKEYPIAPFKLFPNPSSASFKIEGDAGCLKQIKVNSTDGKLIKEFKQPLQQEYSIAEITNGFYQVCLIENSGRVSYLKLNIIR